MLTPQVQRKRVLDIGYAEPERAHLDLLIKKKNRDDLLQSNGIKTTTKNNNKQILLKIGK